ncbi:MAG: four helix bundle protein [Magnetospirillum sp.]|nr:four helix bundle protein [Magnetospirillum sp.]
MALATDLPIYREAYTLLQLLVKLTGQYPRNYRQVLAREVLAEGQHLVSEIFRANCVTGPAKVPHIERVREHLETLRLQLRLSKDFHLISSGQFGDTVVLTTAVGKQATAWLKYARSA